MSQYYFHKALHYGLFIIIIIAGSAIYSDYFALKELQEEERQLLLHTIERTPGERWIRYKHTKQSAKNIINKSYKKEGKKCLLREENIREVYNVVKCAINHYQLTGAFDQREVIQELCGTVYRILSEDKNDGKIYIDSIAINQNGIMLCILSLLQSSQMKLYDKTISESSLKTWNENEVAQSSVNPDRVAYCGSFPVPWTTRIFTVPVIYSDVQVTEYFDDSVFHLSNRPRFSLFEVVRDKNNNLVANVLT